MEVAIIVAVAQNGVMGVDNDLPWRLSTDQRRFRRLTVGHPIIMGRRTWESLPRAPLKERRNIVVTSQSGAAFDGAELAPTLAAALELVKDEEGEVFVIGGERLFQEALPMTRRLYLTEVLAEVEGDRHFPPVRDDEWQEVSVSDHPADEKNEHPTRFRVLERVGEASG